MAELGSVVAAGPDPETDGIVRWRRADLAAVIKKRFDVTYSERGVGELLKVLGFSHISTRPQHPEQDAEDRVSVLIKLDFLSSFDHLG